MKILTIANQKGRQKHANVHLAYARMEAGLRVLLVDMTSKHACHWPLRRQGLPPVLLHPSCWRGTDSHTAGSDHRQLAIIRADNGLLSIDKAENQVIRRPAHACAGLLRLWPLPNW